MGKILIFAGTTEGRELSGRLAAAGIAHTVCVATEYGELALKKHPLADVRRGRMGRGEILSFLAENGFAAVADATHPYAREATENIRAAARESGVPYIRLERETEGFAEGEGDVRHFADASACAEALDEIKGNILLTTGSKELPVFCASEERRRRLYVRTLPSLESLRACMAHGLWGRQVIAAQGPFSVEMNAATIGQYQIRCLVTKASGRAGGYLEKLEAARRAGVPAFVIGKQADDEPGCSFAEACRRLEEICKRPILDVGGQDEGKPYPQDIVARDGKMQDILHKAGQDGGLSAVRQVDGPEEGRHFIQEGEESGLPAVRQADGPEEGRRFIQEGEESGQSAVRQVNGPEEESHSARADVSGALEITLAGVGMGDRRSITEAVLHEIERADVLFGAERLIGPYQPRMGKMPYYSAGQVVPCLKNLQAAAPGRRVRAVVLFSGDSGFYSGCRALKEGLQKEIESGGLRASVKILPGISSVSYLAACMGASYEDAAIYSIHGKEIPDLAEKIARSARTFLLVSGASDVAGLGKLLLDGNLGACRVTVGYQLSYPEQKMMRLTPEECCKIKEAGLYACCVENPRPQEDTRILTHGRKDAEFLRGKVPMTKEEVREACICKLRLCENAVVYDVGSGTGSVAVEIAGISRGIRVFAIERKGEAIGLIRRNKEKFRLTNLQEVFAHAPEGFAGLPRPTHAFIGGSGGRLREILSALYEKNPRMRIVLTAVSLETLAQVKEIFAQYPVEQEELAQIQVSRAELAGASHLMRAENPVWVCAFTFTERKEEGK